MKKIDIGLIGGCMICQPGLDLGDLFFRRLNNKAMSEFNTRCQISLGYYNEYSRIPEIADSLISKNDLSLLMVQIRPAPMLMRNSLIIDDYHGAYKLNPLFYKIHGYAELESILGTKNPDIKDVTRIRSDEPAFLKWCLKNNLRIGELCGLRFRARSSLLRILKKTGISTKKRGVRFLVMGILPAFFPPHNELFHDFNRTLNEKLTGAGIDYLDLFSNMNQEKERYFSSDLYHLSKDGHQMISDSLAQRLSALGLLG
jgi:hypothetical protein